MFFGVDDLVQPPVNCAARIFSGDHDHRPLVFKFAAKTLLTPKTWASRDSHREIQHQVGLADTTHRGNETYGLVRQYPFDNPLNRLGIALIGMNSPIIDVEGGLALLYQGGIVIV